MIRVAIYGIGSKATKIKFFIEELYNNAAKVLGGEKLIITAYIDDKMNAVEDFKEVICISESDYIEMYKHGAIDALIIPVDNFYRQSFLLTDILKAGLSLDDVYILKRLNNVKADTYDEIADYIVPYLSSKYIPYLEYHVADQCNLNCIACEHYSGLVEEEYYPDYEQFEREFVRMKELIDDIGMLRILGGEPLLNKELAKYIELSRRLYPDTFLFVVTNGLLVKSMPAELIEAIKNNNVIISISYYPPLIDQMESIRQFLDSNKIIYQITEVNTKFTKKQTLKKQENTDKFYTCFQAHCHNLYQGKMAACFLPFTTKYFNSYYGENLPEDGDIDIMSSELSSEKLLLGLLQPFERCRYCTEPVEVEWDCLRDKSDMSNWLVENVKEENESQPLVSIYTQCYNGEKYIEKCILSVINQTYSNFEYYICNHGSTDGTQAIIDKYSELDSRVKPLYFDNSARGFYPDFMKENAGGKYFVMLDSDDWWDVNHLSVLVHWAERYKLDMCCCSIKSYDEATGQYGLIRKIGAPLIINVNEMYRHWGECYTFLRTAWGKLISMDVLRKADFSTYFENAKTFISDDTAFSLANFAKCNRVAFLPDELLTYRITSGSVTAKYKDSLVQNNYNIYLQSLEVLRDINDCSDTSLQYITAVFVGSLGYAAQQLIDSEMSVEDKYDEFIRILSLPFVNAVVKQKESKNSGFVIRIIDWIQSNRVNLGEEKYRIIMDTLYIYD